VLCCGRAVTGLAGWWSEWCWRWSGAPMCWGGDNALAVRGGEGGTGALAVIVA